jgi:hypothetical protein
VKNKSYLLIFTVVILAAIFLTGCQKLFKSKGPTIATPTADRAVITGRLINVTSGKPMSGVLVRLAEVYRNDAGEGSYVLDQALSPGTESDEDGYYVFENLTPGEFVLVLGDPLVRYLIINEPNTEKPKVWKVEPGKILDIGELSVDY